VDRQGPRNLEMWLMVIVMMIQYRERMPSYTLWRPGMRGEPSFNLDR
jgi:hypothetical protein